MCGLHKNLYSIIMYMFVTCHELEHDILQSHNCIHQLIVPIMSMATRPLLAVTYQHTQLAEPRRHETPFMHEDMNLQKPFSLIPTFENISEMTTLWSSLNQLYSI